MSKAKTETQILWERDQLVLFLTKLYPCWLEPLEGIYPSIAPIPDYRCVINTPCGLMAWDIEGRHLRYFDHVERKDEITGELLSHTASEQYAMLRMLEQQWVSGEPVEAQVDDSQMNLI